MSRTVFMGNLPSWVTAEEIEGWLSNEDILFDEVKVIRDFETQESKGYAFIEAASDEDVIARREKEIALGDVSTGLTIDGFNLIVTVEAALAGGVLLRCRDGAIRDLASMHGSYRKVDETEKAVALIAKVLEGGLRIGVRWLLDRPVSNAGRLATHLRSVGRQSGQDWDVSLVGNVDALLVASPEPVASSDSRVLNGTSRWVNLVPSILQEIQQELWIVDLNPVRETQS